MMMMIVHSHSNVPLSIVRVTFLGIVFLISFGGILLLNPLDVTAVAVAATDASVRVRTKSINNNNSQRHLRQLHKRTVSQQRIVKTSSNNKNKKKKKNTQIQLYNDTTVSANIVGGTTVTPSSTMNYPFYGYTRWGSLCGATLIHTDIAITAGHCAGFFSRYGMYLGGVYYNGSDAKETLTVIRELRHPQYNGTTYENDILILKLRRSNNTAPYSNVRPVHSINYNHRQPTDNATVVVIGYGDTTEYGENADILQQVSINIINNTLCQQMYRRDGATVTNSMICAAQRGKDACHGDSGGPLLMETQNRFHIKRWQLVGIVSWGIGCARWNRPGVYTRTSSYSEFIKTSICTLSQYKPSYCSRIR